MNSQQISHFKKLLEEEKNKLESELGTIGRKNPSNPNDWEAVPDKMDIDRADETEIADSIETFEDNTALLKQLEIRLIEVNAALAKITAGKYGICEISGEPIENERLEANPAAKTCIAHLEETL